MFQNILEEEFHFQLKKLAYLVIVSKTIVKRAPCISYLTNFKLTASDLYLTCINSTLFKKYLTSVKLALSELHLILLNLVLPLVPLAFFSFNLCIANYIVLSYS